MIWDPLFLTFLHTLKLQLCCFFHASLCVMYRYLHIKSGLKCILPWFLWHQCKRMKVQHEIWVPAALCCLLQFFHWLWLSWAVSISTLSCTEPSCELASWPRSTIYRHDELDVEKKFAPLDLRRCEDFLFGIDCSDTCGSNQLCFSWMNMFPMSTILVCVCGFRFLWSEPQVDTQCIADIMQSMPHLWSPLRL